MPDFSSRTHSRKFNRFTMGQQANAELQKDAFALTPDVDAITKSIADKDLASADYKPLHQEIAGEMSGYLENYNKDPFYAFSREGRATAKRVKDLVNHPEVKEWENNFKGAKKEYERAVTERINKNFVVDGDSVLAIKDGKRQYIPFSEIKELNSSRGDKVLNVDSDMYALSNIFGVRKGIPSYNMTSLEKVDKKIQDTLDKAHLGDTETSGEYAATPGVTGTAKRKSNTNQLTAAITGLMKTGLSDSDKNTLKSEYIKQVGTNTSGRGFNQWLTEKLQGIGSSQISSISDNSTKKAADAGSGSGHGSVKPLGPADLVLSGKYGTRNIDSMDAPGIVSHSVANNLPTDILNISSGSKTDKEGNKIPSRRLGDLGMYTGGAFDLNAAVAQDRKTGQSIKIPGLQNTVASTKKPPALVNLPTYTAPNGEKTLVPNAVVTELARYGAGGDKSGQKIPVNLRNFLSPDGKLMENQWVSMYVISPAPKALIDGSNPTRDALDNAGHEATDKPEAVDYYNQFNGSKDKLDADGSVFWWDDKVHEVHILAPMTSKPALRRVLGDNTWATEDQSDVETGDLQPTWSQEFSAEQYNPASIPNQVKNRTFVY